MNELPNVLIVEDEPDIREILKVFVESLHFKAIVAHDGKDALTKVKENRIDVVISDLMMPHVSGMMLLKELRDSGYINPFIFVTAYPSQEASIQALRLGAFDFLEKPFDGAQVRGLLKEAVKIAKEDNSFSKVIHRGVQKSSVDSAREINISSFEANSSEIKRLTELFVTEVVKQLPFCERSLDGLLNPEVQKWEIGYLMRTMQTFRSAAASLKLTEIADLTNKLEWLAMRSRLDPSLLSQETVSEFRDGFVKLKVSVKELTSIT